MKNIMLNQKMSISILGIFVLLTNLLIPAWAAPKETQGEQPSVQVRFLQNVQSNKINPGDEIAIEATKNYTYKGRVIINEGARGTIKVTEAQKKGFIEGGQIKLGEGHIYATNGQPVKITLTKNEIQGTSMFRNPLFWVSIAMWPMEILEFAHNRKVDKFNLSVDKANKWGGGLFNIKKKSKEYFWTFMSWPLMVFAGSFEAKIKENSKDRAIIIVSSNESNTNQN